ncbi:MAG: lysylphosphatidylglycerol synthase domain-containing protein [Actinomycetota bacterium]
MLAILGIVALSFPAPGPTALDAASADLVAELPGLAGWFWEVSYDLLIVWSLALLLSALFARGRRRLFLDEVLAVAIGLGSAIVVARIGGTDTSTSLDGLLNSSSPPIYIATRVAVATAVIVTASPHLSRPLRHLGRWLIALGVLSGIALGATLPIGAAAGFLIGFASAALTHLIVGSPGGNLTLEQVSDALRELGVGATDLREAVLQPRGVALAFASALDGRPLMVKVFGRDAWDSQLVAATWSAIWHRGAKPVGRGRLQQVEHEAFMTLLAERGGVPVMPVVAAGEADEGDALLVLEADARSFGTLAADEIDDRLLRGWWEILGGLHELGVSHGRVDADRLGVRSDGSPVFIDLGAARVAATENQLLTDRAQLLVLTALAVGSDRAATAASDVIGDDGVAEVLPFLQPAVFDLDTRKAIREQEWSLKDLRTSIAERTDSEIPPLEPIRRITWGSLAKIVVAGLLAYALVSAFADVGIDTIVKEFQNAEWAWLLAALLVTPFAQVPQAFSTMGATLQSIRFWPVLMLQYGVQFIALAVPSSAARVALEIRFFERVGVPGAGAISIGLLDSFSTFVIQMLLIGIILLSGLVSLDLSSSEQSSSDGSSGSFNWQALLIATALVVLALVIALLVPKTRAMLHRFWGILREKASDAKDALRVLRHPMKLLLLLGGNFVAQVMLAIILGVCLKAFGQSTSLAALILVNTFVSLFAGFMPVPGGVGVAEAGYTAGLIAVGIPEGAATSTAMAFRLVTFYLPPLWGTFAMRWMKAHSYL